MQRWPRRTLPVNLNPVGTRCIQITIPDEDEWERAMYAEVVTLAQWMRWERDLGKNGKPVADIWLKALKTWKHCDGSPSPIHGMEVEEDMGLRIDCDCNVFITCCDGTEKQILTKDQVQELLNTQPGAGAPQAPPGGCQTYPVSITGYGVWQLPQVVNTGDVLTPSNFQGASTNDAPLSRWNCPDGSLFLGGKCFDVKIKNPSDPLPTAYLGIPIAYIAGTYYDLSAPLTIPSGIANQPVMIMLNYQAGFNAAGTVTFQLELCNNQSGNINITYSHGSGLTSVPYGTTFLVTAQDIGSDVRIDMAFDHPVALSILSSTGYVNVGTPGPTNEWGISYLGGVKVVRLVDPPATQPTDYPGNPTVDTLTMDTGGPSAVFTITVRVDQP